MFIIYFAELDGYLGFNGNVVDDKGAAERLTLRDAESYAAECRDGSGAQVEPAVEGDEYA